MARFHGQIFFFEIPIYYIYHLPVAIKIPGHQAIPGVI